jgi:hypothetical protein
MLHPYLSLNEFPSIHGNPNIKGTKDVLTLTSSKVTLAPRTSPPKETTPAVKEGGEKKKFRSLLRSPKMGVRKKLDLARNTTRSPFSSPSTKDQVTPKKTAVPPRLNACNSPRKSPPKSPFSNQRQISKSTLIDNEDPKSRTDSVRRKSLSSIDKNASDRKKATVGQIYDYREAIREKINAVRKTTSHSAKTRGIMNSSSYETTKTQKFDVNAITRKAVNTLRSSRSMANKLSLSSTVSNTAEKNESESDNSTSSGPAVSTQGRPKSSNFHGATLSNLLSGKQLQNNETCEDTQAGQSYSDLCKMRAQKKSMDLKVKYEAEARAISAGTETAVSKYAVNAQLKRDAVEADRIKRERNRNEVYAINEYLRKIEQSRFEKMLKSYADGDFSRRLETLSVCSTESDNILTPRNLNDREHPLRGSV